MSRLPPKIRRASLAALALIGVLLTFAPVLVTLFWHLRHGSALQYRGRTIRVPRRWIARAEPQGLTLSKLPLTVFSLDRFSGAIDLSLLAGRRSVTLDEVYLSWERALRTLAAEMDEDVTGPVRTGTGPVETICMKFSSTHLKAAARASCLLFQGTWSAEFIGDEEDIDTFFQVVRSIN